MYWALGIALAHYSLIKNISSKTIFMKIKEKLIQISKFFNSMN